MTQPPTKEPTQEMIDWQDIEDVLSDAIADSLEMNWSSRDGAKACVAALKELPLAMRSAHIPATSEAGCRNCDGGQWVCENHGDRPWDGTSAREDACGCGAGAPCAVCSPLANSHLISTLQKTRDKLEGVVSQMDFAGCTCTFQSDDCCSYAGAAGVIAEADKVLAALTAQQASPNERSCDLCAGECRGHSFGCPEDWKPEPGSRASDHCGIVEVNEEDFDPAKVRESDREALRQAFDLWALLDDIDTLDDACRADDASFRAHARTVQQKRFKIMPAKQWTDLHKEFGQ